MLARKIDPSAERSANTNTLYPRTRIREHAVKVPPTRFLLQISLASRESKKALADSSLGLVLFELKTQHNIDPIGCVHGTS
jgi:hypothetical protein